jgi:hypothetical protein
MFSRPHHQRIAKVLESLDGDLLKQHNCLFAGGTAIALRYGEYRESVDMDFLVSDLASYRYLRNLVREQGLQALMRSNDFGQLQTSDIRSDQYGIRTKVFVQGKPITLDMAASKLLANSDRGLDMGMHCRDVIDLAMLNLSKTEFFEAATKSKAAYGEAILKDLSKVIDRLGEANGLLERCMKAMDVSVPRALLWQNISNVKSWLADGMPR